MESKRLVAISAVRLIAMVMIIACHILQYYKLELAWWLNVGVQIFLIISGFLSGIKTINDPIDFLKRRFYRILIPYYSLLILYIILSLLFSVKLHCVDILKAVFSFADLPGLQHLWFVSNILFCYLITPFLSEFAKTYKRRLLPFMGFVFIYIMVSSIINAHFGHHIICCYILGFYIGQVYINSTPSLKSVFMSRLTVLMSCFAFLANALRVIVSYVCNEWMDMFSHRLWVLFSNYCHLLLGGAIFCIIFKLFHDAEYNRIFEMSDKYSYEIYLSHHLFILSPFTLMSVTTSPYINIMIVLLGTVVLSVILKKITTYIDSSLTLKI